MDKSESIFIQFVVLTVTLDKLQTIADNLRPYTADAMKIEVAPWIKDYVVDMDDLYTDLSLEKIHNEPTGEDCKRLNHYTELFERMQRCNPQLCEPPAKSHRTDLTSNSSPDKCDKILMKGDPGMGKTTQCKKISWDWAMRLFTYFRIVFFVFLKFVKPGDIIENIIIKQNPYMKGLEITEQKLRDVLRLFGRECLLILDGLDEHAVGTNEDVLSIIRGEKYLKCNIIVTSRPHSTSDIEKYFPTIVRVEGFTRSKAKQFTSKILKDEKLIEAVLDYNPKNFNKRKYELYNQYKCENPIHKCPILLSFLCLLAREDDIDFMNTKMHTGEIYARMVRCLYKKYVIRKGLCYDSDQFEKAMISIGKLALKTLLSGDPLLKRDDVIREIGEHAFDYGLLIGHEDFRLIWDETADIFVTFPHRSIQEFLGALYFIWMLDMGEEIQSLLGSKLIFLTNTLFLQFCLWFLSKDQRYFTFKAKHKGYQSMVHYCVELLNKEELNLDENFRTYRALDISSTSVYSKDESRVSFMRDILAKNKTSSLLMSTVYSIKQFLSLINPNLKSITFIASGVGEHSVSYIKSTELAIWTKVTNLSKLSAIIEHYKKLMNDPIVHLHLGEPTGLYYSIKKPSILNVRTLCLSGVRGTTFMGRKQQTCTCKLAAFSPRLRQLRLEHIQHETILQRVINEMCGDILLNLNHLSLVRCYSVSGVLPVLFKSAWPHLHHLSLLDTWLSEDDLEFLCLTCNGPEKNLPNLTSLCLTVPRDMTTDAFYAKFFMLSWLELKQLYVDCKCDSNTGGLNIAIRDRKLPNLTCLKIRTVTTTQQAIEPLCLDKLANLQTLYLKNCIQRGEFQIVLNTQLLSQLSITSTDGLMGDSSLLITHGFPKLKTLALSNCALTSQDLASLTQAKVKGRLPVLKDLDISCNELSLPEFNRLFDGHCAWPELLSLDITGSFKGVEEDKVIDYMNEIISFGYLPSLQKLGINRFDNRNAHWNCLEKLFLDECKENELSNITDSVFWGYLPTLQTLCVKDFRGHNAEDTRMLSQLGVSCHQTYVPLDNEFSRVKCLCEK